MRSKFCDLKAGQNVYLGGAIFGDKGKSKSRKLLLKFKKCA